MTPKKSILSCRKVSQCRSCGSTDLKPWVNLGKQPLANDFTSKPVIPDVYPLETVVCQVCTLIQLSYVVSKEKIFSEYTYHSSVSPVFRNHFVSMAQQVTDYVGKIGTLVDIGSNDGVLLEPFSKLGWSVVGVEPAVKIAKAAQNRGIPTIADYYTDKVARKILTTLGKVDVVTMTNVFAHVDDVEKLLIDIKRILKPTGHLIIEVPNTMEMIHQGTFDLIYHEHLSYFTPYSLSCLLKHNGFSVVNVQSVPVHGGSMRVYAQMGDMGDTVDRRGETILSMPDFVKFEEKIQMNMTEIKKILAAVKGNVAGYGAPAKMTVLLYAAGIPRGTLQFTIDDDQYKQGLYSPGLHIPVYSFSTARSKWPDNLFNFAWNFQESVIAKCKEAGFKGRFIIPFPSVNTYE